jgi:aminoglycoside 3-N-acetyltransferase
MTSALILNKNDCCVTISDINDKLREIGLCKGDIVLVHSSLGKIGPIEGIPLENRQMYAAAVFEAFANVLDIQKSGTLVVPTFTHEYARHGVPFIYEESPSEVGMFTEYVRKLPGALRSIHPINSFTAIGSKQREICEGVSISCYGYNSVFDRLYQHQGKMLFLGASMRHMTLKHHLEQMVALPYVYMKAYFTRAYKDGEELRLPFLAVVRYLNGKVENNDCSQFHEHLRQRKMLRETKIGGAEVVLTSIVDAFDEGYELLQRDPCYFLEEPFYMTE